MCYRLLSFHYLCAVETLKTDNPMQDKHSSSVSNPFPHPSAMKRFFLLLLCCALGTALTAQTYQWARDIPYTVKTDAYARERLLLDVYYPEGQTDRPVIVWFHGGGLEAGAKEIPTELRERGYVVVGVNYRLLPRVTVDQTIDDAAEAVAWTLRHAADYGGSARKVFVTGHSAGGYLSMMLCLDKSWLARYQADADSIAAYIPFSGQAITHYNVRKMQGIKPLQPTIDRYAPLYWVRADCPPLVLICGDRELELYGRYDENQYLARMMRLCGHRATSLYELQGFDHGSMVHPAFSILEKHIRACLERQ